MILLAISFCMSQFSLAAQPVHVKVREIPPKKAQSEKPAYSPEHIRLLVIKAAHGDPSAQSSLATCYGRGNGIPKDNDKAFFWAEKAAQQNDPHAYFTLFTCYYQGFGCQKDMQKAIEALEKGALLGDANCQYNLAYFTYHGKLGIKKDMEKALELARQSSRQGHADALKFLSLAYINGEGVERNVPLALKYLEQAAKESNDPEYYTEMGNFYLLLCKKDNPLASMEIAEQCFSQAAKMGNVQAAKKYAQIQQLRTDASQLKQQMQPGDRDALLRLGQLYIHGIEGAPLDKKEGYRFILEAANLDSPEAQYLLGKAYESGNSVKKAVEQDVRWLRKSAAQRTAGDQTELGIIYIQGEGVERNEHAAGEHW